MHSGLCNLNCVRIFQALTLSRAEESKSNTLRSHKQWGRLCCTAICTGSLVFTGEQTYHNTAASEDLLRILRKKKKRKSAVGGPEKDDPIKVIYHSALHCQCIVPSQAGQRSAVITPPPLTTCMIVFLTPYYFVSTFQRVLFLNCQSGPTHPPPTICARLFIITIINNCHLPTTTEQTHCLITMSRRLFRRRARVSLATGPSQLLCWNGIALIKP